jgi:hypothetical protein
MPRREPGSDDRAAVQAVYPGAGSAPRPPSNLAASPVSATACNLSWTDNATTETGFSIERKVSGVFTEVATAPANAHLTNVAGLGPGTANVFRVRSRNASGSSVPSNEATCNTPAATAACVQGATKNCLLANRFQVVDTFLQNGSPAAAGATRFNDGTGLNYFFDPGNIELLCKVLNACGLNNRYWVFCSGLTNVEVLITVTDTKTGATKKYFNPQGTAFPPIQDTDAFATCP